MEIVRDELLPVPGLSREIGLMVAGLEEVQAQTVKFIADLTPDELSARFLPGFHQIGALALHLGECEFWWIQAIAARKPMTDEDKQFAHLDDTTESDFALKGYDAHDCINFLERIHLRTLDTLTGFTDEEIDRLISMDPHPTRFEGSLRWISHHLIDHEANHKGQIAMIKRLIREGS